MFEFYFQCNTYKIKKSEAGFFYPFTFTDIAGIHNESNSIMTNDIQRLLNGHIIDGYTVSIFNLRNLSIKTFHKML